MSIRAKGRLTGLKPDLPDYRTYGSPYEARGAKGPDGPGKLETTPVPTREPELGTPAG